MACRAGARFWMSIHAAATAVERWTYRRYSTKNVVLPDEVVPAPPRKRMTVSLPAAHELVGRPMPVSAIIFERCPVCAGDFVELIPQQGLVPARIGCPNCGWPLKRAESDLEKFGTVPRAWQLPLRR